MENKEIKREFGTYEIRNLPTGKMNVLVVRKDDSGIWVVGYYGADMSNGDGTICNFVHSRFLFLDDCEYFRKEIYFEYPQMFDTKVEDYPIGINLIIDRSERYIKEQFDFLTTGQKPFCGTESYKLPE